MKSRHTVSLFAAAAITMTLGATIAAHADSGPAPGTAERPVLSETEAARFTPENYFASSGPLAAPVADPWSPGDITVQGVEPAFVVGATVGVDGATHDTVQRAVNAAVTAGGTDRQYIRILPGTYAGTVFIPAEAPPLTLYGEGSGTDVRLEFTVDGASTAAEWAAQVNPSDQYAELQVRGLTVTNTLLDTVDEETHQALAVRTDGDRAQFQDVRLIGRQDTFHANSKEEDSIARVSVRDSYLEGDTDFVFGRASAVFDGTEFHLVSSRKPADRVIFAPSTASTFGYGFLVRNSRLTADDGYRAAPTGHLGRAWDQGASTTGYQPGASPNGQLVIRESQLGPGFDEAAPWASAGTKDRPSPPVSIRGATSTTRRTTDCGSTPTSTRTGSRRSGGVGGRLSGTRRCRRHHPRARSGGRPPGGG